MAKSGKIILTCFLVFLLVFCLIFLVYSSKEKAGEIKEEEGEVLETEKEEIEKKLEKTEEDSFPKIKELKDIPSIKKAKKIIHVCTGDFNSDGNVENLVIFVEEEDKKTKTINVNFGIYTWQEKSKKWIFEYEEYLATYSSSVSQSISNLVYCQVDQDLNKDGIKEILLTYTSEGSAALLTALIYHHKEDSTKQIFTSEALAQGKAYFKDDKFITEKAVFENAEPMSNPKWTEIKTYIIKEKDIVFLESEEIKENW